MFPAGNRITAPFKAHQLTEPNTKHHEDFAWFGEKLMGFRRTQHGPAWTGRVGGVDQRLFGGCGGRSPLPAAALPPVVAVGESLGNAGKAALAPGGARAALRIRTECAVVDEFADDDEDPIPFTEVIFG